MLVGRLYSHDKKRGIALPLTLTVILVLGIFAGSFYEMVASEKREVARRHAKTQAYFSALSALEYASYRMQENNEPWRSKGVDHANADSSITFTLSATQNGVYSQLKAEGMAKYGRHDIKKKLDARAGYWIKGLPVLTLLDINAGVSLAGTSRIEGDVALRNGKVEKSTHYKMPASSSAEHVGKVFNDTWPLWDSIAFYPRFSGRALELQLENLGDKKCTFDGRDTIKGLHVCKNILIQGEAFCDSCTLIAEHIQIRGNASMKNGFFAAGTISASERVQLSGQLLARDTLSADLEITQHEYVTLAVQGHKTGAVEYVGRMDIPRFRGKALLLYQGENWDASLKGISVSLGSKVKIDGLVLVHGFLDIQGLVQGSVVAWNLAFEEESTIWQGYLKNAQIVQDTSLVTLVPDVWRIGGVAGYAIR